MSIVREKLVKEDIELGHGIALITDPTDPTGAKMSGNKVGVHTFTPKVYNVMDFGAVGDGSTDDTTAIQLAITTAGADSVVLFPVGDYLISDALTITNSNVVLRGLGARWASGNGALIQSNDATADVLTITGVDNVLIENLSLRHKVVANAGTYVINVQGGNQILIRDCAIVSASGTTNCRVGVYFQGTATKAISNCRVDNCYLKNLSFYGVLVTGYSAAYKASNVAIQACSIDNCTADGIYIGDYVTNLSVDNCKISNSGRSVAIVATAAGRTNHLCIRNCDMEDSVTNGLINGYYAEYVLIEGNRLKTPPVAAFAIYADPDCLHWQILGNQIYDVAEGGISFGGITCVIAGNYIWGTGYAILFAVNSMYCFAGSNYLGGTTDVNDTGSSNACGFNYSNNAAMMHHAVAAVPDGNLSNQEFTIWVDESGNNLTFKVKYSNGTVKSGTVALT